MTARPKEVFAGVLAGCVCSALAAMWAVPQDPVTHVIHFVGGGVLLSLLDIRIIRAKGLAYGVAISLGANIVLLAVYYAVVWY